MQDKFGTLILRTQRRVSDKIFFLLWASTLVQAGLIVWNWINLFFPEERLFILRHHAIVLGAKTVHATDYTTGIYLALLLAYTGKKEFARWSRGIPRTFHFTAPGILSDEETVRRFRKGDLALVFWGVLTLLAVLSHGVGFIPELPAQLLVTFLQVLGLYALALGSKNHREEKERERKASESVRMTLAAPRVKPVSEELTSKLLDLIAKEGPIKATDIISRLPFPRSTVGLYLRRLTLEGKIDRNGTTRNAVYRVPATR